MAIPWEWTTVTTFVQDFLTSSFIASAAGALTAIGIAGAILMMVRRYARLSPEVSCMRIE